MGLTLIVTNAGRTALVNAANTGTNPVSVAQVGLSGTAITPNTAATALPGEFKRLTTLSGDVVADDTIHLIVRDESSDVFTVRSLALYLADGTLFAIYGQAGVLIEKSAQALMLLAIDVQFADIDADSLTFGDANFLNPPATTEQKGVVELSTLAETMAGTDTSRVPPEKMVKDAVFAWLDARFGANNSGIWHPGNDGAGSGLDADLLDGQDSAYFSNISARLGYTPVQQGTGNGQGANAVKIGWSGSRLKATVDVTDQGNFVFDGHIADVWRSSNDGAGSGLDADLLDGQDSSYFTNITARLGYTPVNKAGDTMTGSLGFNGTANVVFNSVHTGEKHVEFVRSGQTAYFYGSASGVGLYDTQYGSVWSWSYGGDFAIKGSKAWTAANDGAGSGLDADLLDGRDSSAFSLLDGTTLFTGPVKVGYANGLLLKPDTGGNNATVIHRNDGSSYYLLLSNAGTSITETWNALRPLLINLTTGLLTSLNGQNFSGGAAFTGTVTMNGSTVWNAGNDGAGSGLDADLLDGLDSSAFARRDGQVNTARDGGVVIAGANGSDDVWSAGLQLREVSYAGNADVNSYRAPALCFHWSGVAAAALKMYADGTFRFRDQSTSSTGYRNVYAANFYSSGNLVWSAGNDGAGSGLDADMVDGYHAGSFALWSGGTFSGGIGAPSLSLSGSLTVSSSNTTGGGIILADDGDIVDLNDSYCSMRFTNGVRIFSANKGGSAVITLGSNGTISLQGATTSVSGSAPLYFARARVTFNGAGTVAITESGNVSSITDSGVGAYGINFTTAMPTSTYQAAGMAGPTTDDRTISSYGKSTSALQIRVVNSSGAVDTTDISVVIFG